MSIQTRASLLLRIRDHRDGAAWMDFVAIYEPVIYRLARSRLLARLRAIVAELER